MGNFSDYGNTRYDRHHAHGRAHNHGRVHAHDHAHARDHVHVYGGGPLQ